MSTTFGWGQGRYSSRLRREVFARGESASHLGTEGGASMDGATSRSRGGGGHLEDQRETAASSMALDQRQDELMAKSSSDGRPPSHHLRVLEWRWLLIGVGIVIGGGAAWAALAGMGGDAMVAGAAYVLFLLVGCSPVWASGVLRGQEERAARRAAKSERRVVRPR